MQASSALDFVKRAMKLLGVLDPAEDPEPDEAADGLVALNEFIDDLATQRQTIYAIARTLYPLTANVSSYTLGTGGVWDQVRPVWIERASVVPDRTVAKPIEIPIGAPITLKEYQAIAQKLATALYPDRLFWDQGWAAGLSTILVYPVPTASVASIVLYTPTALTVFADLATQYTFPPAYARMLRYNLAMELAPDYDVTPSALVVRNAGKSLANVKRANFKPTEASFDAALVRGRGYNIYTDR